MRLIKLKNLSLKRSITVATYICHYRMEYNFHLSFSICFISFIYVCLHESVDIHYVLITEFRVSNIVWRRSLFSFRWCWLKHWLCPLPVTVVVVTALRLRRISNNILQPKTHKFFIWCFIFSIPKLLLFIVLTWMH